MYGALDPNKMWTLSTGTKVEQQMERYALDCSHEHPCHSLILDTMDETWNDYFTAEEIREIKDYQRPTPPPPPREFLVYLDAISLAETALDARDIAYTNIRSISHIPSCDWAFSVIISTSRLFKKSSSGVIFDLIAEAELLVRPWNLLLSAFEESAIDALPMDWNRTLDDVEIKERTKVALLYKSGVMELGCVELKDGYLKQPKALKDMLYALASEDPSLTSKFSTTGFTIMGSKLTMMTMTCPKGYVAKLSRSKPIAFPAASAMFGNSMKSILTLVWSGKQLMESNLQLASSSPLIITTDPYNDSIQPSDTLLQPSFHPAAPAASSSSS
ncbi:unnamed protein product [Absidia cylindrospora]